MTQFHLGISHQKPLFPHQWLQQNLAVVRAITKGCRLVINIATDDSHESPLKAMLERKKRSMETRMRLEGSLSMTDNRQALVDQEARNAMTRASSLLSSMDKSSLLQMSSLLEQMRSKVQDELRRKAGI
jgi:hypothetical protein